MDFTKLAAVGDQIKKFLDDATARLDRMEKKIDALQCKAGVCEHIQAEHIAPGDRPAL